MRSTQELSFFFDNMFEILLFTHMQIHVCYKINSIAVPFLRRSTECRSG